MDYQEFGPERALEAIEIYGRNGWQDYLSQRDLIGRALDASLYTLGAFDGGRLVGFVRCVGDGTFVVLVQDLIVDPSYWRQGIGGTLLAHASQRFLQVLHFLLLTDEADGRANAFYQAMGMVTNDHGWDVAAYFRPRGRLVGA